VQFYLSVFVRYAPNLGQVGQKSGFYSMQMATHWNPVIEEDGENNGFRTGCPVFTDLWSYVLSINVVAYLMLT